jgi:hypothetical protein
MSPVEPVVALMLPLPGAARAGKHDSGSHVGSAMLHTFVGKHTEGFAWLGAKPWSQL